ncbi:hypothetical protein [Rubrimonas cliftonensis]|uniref:Uncharacterized protein n=1 Tax=Rubrimonas cliftonensis TaxID=89524 RepID=A0A1H3W039_9RHOB|nr:hypothetical protein [Rubrimonas cliftonensis]SDZ80505.1 hypothetical protein SAMN05444370_101441 [Rubrimonas cliftonensis]
MKRMPLILAAVVFTAPASPWAQDWNRVRPAPKDGYAYPECYCTNRGARVEVGETACLRVDGREFTALCAMSLNNPAWRRQGEGCPPDGLSLAPRSTAPRAPG